MTVQNPMPGLTQPLYAVLRQDSASEPAYFYADLTPCFSEAASQLADAMAAADKALMQSVAAGAGDPACNWQDLPYLCRVIRLDLPQGRSAEVTPDALAAIARWCRQRAPYDPPLGPALQRLGAFVAEHPLAPPAAPPAI